MADYFLKNSDATRVYRIVYVADAESHVTVSGAYACATGAAAVLPNGNPIEVVDQPIDLGQVLADDVLNSLVAGTLTEYRTQAKAMVDSMWSS